MKKEYNVLFTPCKIGGLEIKNRFVVPAMSFTDVITWSNHSQTENRIEDFLIRKARDGVGCFVFGCLYVFSQTNTDDWLYKHPDLFSHIPALMDTLHAYGCKAIQQLGFGAGKAYIMPPFLQDKYDTDEMVRSNADVMMASADAGLPNRWTPERKTTYLTKERIREIIHGIAEAAYLCKINGIDGVEVHASHEGYMLDQFIAPYCNHRTDEYGGSLENRLRFACEIVKAIKERCGEEYPVLIRYSLVSKTKDFQKGIIPQDHESAEIGKTIEESQQAMKILSEAGYDAFDVDNGTYDSWYYPLMGTKMPMIIETSSPKSRYISFLLLAQGNCLELDGTHLRIGALRPNPTTVSSRTKTGRGSPLAPLALYARGSAYAASSTSASASASGSASASVVSAEGASVTVPASDIFLMVSLPDSAAQNLQGRERPCS